jgi:two-component system sensor histidine kinase UhpB
MSKDIVRVLLVEDSPSDARLLCESLEDYPLQRFEIEGAERLNEALTFLSRKPFDVILLDLNLPDSSGLETCQRLSRAAGQAPIIILTGADDEAIAAEAMRLGVQDYLVKGQAYGSVIGRTIRYTVERSQANARLQEQAEELQSRAEELRTQAEELATVNATLRESEERLHLAMEAGRVGIWEWEVGTERVTWSQGIYALLGYTPGAVTSTHQALRQRIHPEDLTRHDQALRESMVCCEDYACEFRVVWADGSVHWVEGRGQYAYVDNAEGISLRMRGVLSDVDRRKRAEEALRELNATLESRVTQRTAELLHRTRQLQKLTLELSETEDRERKRMAEILHDDLQQVLAAAKFHVSLMRNRVKRDSSLEATAGQIDQMLKDAIEKSRRLSHELSPALYQVDLPAILEWLARHMQQKHGLTVRVEVHGPLDSPSEPLKAFLYKVAQELLFNVVKHAGVREARIRVRRRGPRLYLSVADRGRGFNPQRLEMALGFGLQGIRERVQLLGGRMKIRSTPGTGSALLIALPYEPAARTQDAGPPKCEDASDTPLIPLTP